MSEVTSSYGLALFSLSLEQNVVETRQKEIKELRNILLQNADFITVLSSSFLSLEERLNIIDKNLNSLDEDVKNFLKIICQNNRAKLLIEIFDSFNSYCNEHLGVKEGILYSTVPVPEETKRKIESKIAQLEKCSIELVSRIDPALIGGIKVLINSHIYDGSVSGKIEKMKVSLLEKENRSYENKR
ncbi:MAG TPA: ATP synthase F1 subunit delta [Bacilli bacterium]|nr:ATP synthase F1 subunit delta [Bacilli bacterium]HPS18652.1 ATP synthase F1 subunit delta [Bacilli bacterium]